VGVDPVTALSQWYFDRNVNVPCPTRVQHDVDWDQYLLDAVTNGRADGVVVLLPKFCEPHMLMYPELRKALEEHQVPHVLLETEHQGLPLEAFRTRLEALVEGIHRRSAVGA
jgi:benzoyl-CoA reductase/2-hydroxyglutaryl-CoA dehydratase subunit BcrC/BadD/HgdB